MPKQTPNFEAQRAADLSALSTQNDLASRLSEALTGNEGLTPKDFLQRKGGLSGESKLKLRGDKHRVSLGTKITQRGRAQDADLSIGRGEVDKARSQGHLDRQGRQQARVTQFEEDQQRSDLNQIFGRNLSQSVAQVASNTGSIKEKAPRRSGGDRFFDGVNEFLGDLFCWVAREVLGTENNDWLHARNWMLDNLSNAEIKLYLDHGKATASRLTPAEALSLKPFFLSIVEEDKTNA